MEGREAFGGRFALGCSSPYSGGVGRGGGLGRVVPLERKTISFKELGK